MNEKQFEKACKNINPSFMLLPSLSCPAECKYCFGPNRGPSISIETTRKCIQYIKKITLENNQKNVNVTLHGGEPLAAGYNIIEYIVSELQNELHGVEISIQSNLWLLDDVYCKLFKNYNVSLGTSLDGYKEVNDIQRGEGYFDNTMRGISIARKYGLSVGCIATFTKYSYKHWKEIFNFFIANNLHFSFHHTVAFNNFSSELAMSEIEYVDLFKKMFEYYLEHVHEIKVSTFDSICKSISHDCSDTCTFKDCTGMFLAIDPNGDIYSCQRFTGNNKFKLGNVEDDFSYTELFSSAAGNQLKQREGILAHECSDCAHYNYCKGGCAFNGYTSGKDKLTDPMCSAYKKIFEYVKGKIYDELLSEENLNAIDENNVNNNNPLLAKGKIIDIINDSHPYDVTRTARRIIAAYELARNKNVDEVKKRLIAIGICKTEQSADYSLNKMLNGINDIGIKNKLYLHITWNCQLHCSHCYASSSADEGSSDMKIDDICKIITDAHNCNFKEIVITGGEPLIHKNIKELLLAISQIRQENKSINIVLRTNLSFPLTINDWILISTAFSKIVISLDGDAEHHNKRRGKNSYETIMENMNVFNDHKNEIMSASDEHGPVTMSLAAALNYDDIKDGQGQHVKGIAEKYNIKDVTIRPILPLGRAEGVIQKSKSMPIEYNTSAKKKLKDGFYPRNTCGIGEELYIEPNGDAYPCYAFCKPQSLIGNVIKDGIIKILDSDKFVSIRCHTVDTNRKCKNCDYKYLCGGACRAWEGEDCQYDLDAPPQNCEANEKRAKYLYKEAMAYLKIVVIEEQLDL